MEYMDVDEPKLTLNVQATDNVTPQHLESRPSTTSGRVDGQGIAEIDQTKEKSPAVKSFMSRSDKMKQVAIKKPIDM